LNKSQALNQSSNSHIWEGLQLWFEIIQIHLNPSISAAQRIQNHFPIHSSVSAQTVVAAHLSFSLFLQQAFCPIGHLAQLVQSCLVLPPVYRIEQQHEQSRMSNAAASGCCAMRPQSPPHQEIQPPQSLLSFPSLNRRTPLRFPSQKLTN
jgi:hypothetical protein